MPHARVRYYRMPQTLMMLYLKLQLQELQKGGSRADDRRSEAAMEDRKNKVISKYLLPR